MNAIITRDVSSSIVGPFYLTKDHKRFDLLTLKVHDQNNRNAVIMDSEFYYTRIPQGQKPMKHRLNVIVSETGTDAWPNSDTVRVAKSLEEALKIVKSYQKIENVWVTGTTRLFRSATPYVNAVYETIISDNVPEETTPLGKWTMFPGTWNLQKSTGLKTEGEHTFHHAVWTKN